MRTNKAFWVAVFFLSGIGQVLSQPLDTLWTYTYEPSGSTNSDAYTVAPTSDGGFLVGGTTGSASTFPLLVRLDGNGEEMWSRDSVGALNSVFSIIPVGSEETVLAGLCGYGDSIGVVKMNGNQQVWARYFNLPGDDEAIRMVAAGGDGFMVCSKGASAYNNGHLLRLDANGDTLWTRSLDVPLTGLGLDMDLLATPDGGFLLCGAQYHHAFVAKTDETGHVQWSTVFGVDTLLQSLNSAALLADGSFIVAGMQSLNREGFTYNPFYARIGPDGDTLWTRVYTEHGRGGISTVRVLPSGRLIMDLNCQNNLSLLCADTEGNPLWGIVLDLPYGQVTSFMCLTPDGGLVVAGSEQWHAWVARTTSIAPITPVSPFLVSRFKLLPNFPNPFNSATQIEFMLPSTQRVLLRLYDVLGREVAVMMDEIRTAGKHEMMFDASGLPSGVYLCRLEAGGMGQTKKMVLLK